MTTTRDPDATSRDAAHDGRRGRHRRRIDPREIASICPYLVADDGAWRTAHPARDHRCAAVRPLGPITLDYQRETCLGSTHVACPAYVAIRATAWPAGASPDPGSADPPLWPIARTSPVLLETPGFHLGSLPGLAGRPGGQAILGALMVLAFVAVVISRTVDPGAGSAASPSLSPSPTPSVTPSPTARPTPSPSASPSLASPSASVAPSATGGTGQVAGAREYRVQAGDTLSGIAAQFETTVGALMEANGITDASLLRIGQRLTIP